MGLLSNDIIVSSIEEAKEEIRNRQNRNESHKKLYTR